MQLPAETKLKKKRIATFQIQLCGGREILNSWTHQSQEFPLPPLGAQNLHRVKG